MILDLQNLQQKYNIQFNGVLHIGANAGGEYGAYKHLNISPIIFVEALPHIFEQLKQNVGSECLLLQTALGNQVGEIVMHTEIGSNNGSSSVLVPKIHATQYPHINLTGQTTVPITKVDELKIPQVNFINIDVQGYELEVFKGSQEYLKNVNFIMSEVNNAELYEGCAMVSELDEYLKGFGFNRVETHWAGGNWGDAFYVKQNG
jgi:FkbM family methyltransferase